MSIWAELVDQRARWFCLVRQLPVVFRGFAVVDVETSGLDPVADEMLGFGLAYDSYLLGCVRMYGSDREMRCLARDVVESLLRDGVPVYAWYKEFEEKWLGVSGLRELQLRPYEKKDAALRLGIDLYADGRSVPRLWERWQRYRDAEALLRILWRGMYDAYVEAVSLFRRRLHILDPLDISSSNGIDAGDLADDQTYSFLIVA